MDHDDNLMEEEQPISEILVENLSKDEPKQGDDALSLDEQEDIGDESEFIKVFECGLCNTGYFKTGAALANHLSFVHGKKEKLTCEICNVKFPHKKDLICHRNVHKMENKGNFSCPVCSKRFHRTNLVMDHLNKVHVGSVETEDIFFSSLSEFFEWKEQLELATKSSFINFRGTSKNKNGISVYYVCHRNGTYVPRGNQKRALKKSGSNKINGFCPARMFVKTFGDEVKVKFTKTHYGHSMEVERMALSKREKDEIANKIAMKVPLDDILDEIKESLHSESLSRKHLLAKKDLYNIAACYNLGKSSIKTKTQISSFDDWIVELEKCSNSARLYKASGTILSDFPQLNSDDFVLIVATDSQLRLLEAYGNELVCVDWIHQESVTDVHLFPLLITDELNEAYPVAFLFSNRVDGDVFEIYFSIMISCLTSELKPKYFMSDIESVFFNSWCVVSTWEQTKKFYCSWLLDSRWRIALSKIPKKDKQVELYKNLKIVMSQVSESAFTVLCDNLFQCLLNDSEAGEFTEYFSNFISDPIPWADCFRPHSLTKVNVSLENIHKVLKNLFLCGKRDNMIERGFEAVVKYARDRLYEREVRLNKGKDPRKMLDIVKRHDASLKMSTELVNCSGPGVWRLISAKSSNEICEISINDPTCECSLRCEACEICNHYYKCNCPTALKTGSCKHVHLIARMIREDIGLLVEVEEIELEDESLPLQEISGFENSEFLFTSEDCNEDTGNVTNNPLDLSPRVIMSKTEPEVLLDRKTSLKLKIIDLVESLESIEEIGCLENLLAPAEEAISNIRKSRTFEVVVSVN